MIQFSLSYLKFEKRCYASLVTIVENNSRLQMFFFLFYFMFAMIFIMHEVLIFIYFIFIKNYLENFTICTMKRMLI